ncbi:MAG: hypothetical protein IT347_05220 [Candidatus Eisenbacteria bacterium]|nr:hypothetical protein [Candidatus Eisenbacteria bacterium]
MTSAARHRHRGAPVALLGALCGLLLAGGCGGTGHPSAPGGGPLPFLGLVPNPTDANFANPDSNLAAIQLLQSTGVDFTQSGDLWSSLEPTPGAIDGARVRFQARVFATLGLAQYYNLRIVDTNQRGVPADLAATAWDAPEMLARVDAMVDTLLAVAANWPFVALSLGNEVDGYFGQPAHQAEFPAYLALVRREIARVHAARPGLKVACCTTSPPANPAAWVGDSLNASTDVRVYTYYPFVPASDFQHRPPTVLDGDLDAIVARAATPVLLQEVGYSSSAACGSSPAAQAEFVRRFRRWHARQSRDRVLGANYFLFTDWTSATLNRLFAYYGGTSPGFAGYLGGLGLRDSLGRAKPSWEAWRAP